MKRSIWILALVSVLGCMTPDSRAPGTIISPRAEWQGGWTENEKAASTVMRNLRVSAEASFHVLRVQTELPMRKHANSDLVLVVVAGKVELQLGNRAIPSAPGDVVEVPRDVPYAVKNRSNEAAVLYAMYSPGLKSEDIKLIREAQTGGDWQWNLWAQ